MILYFSYEAGVGVDGPFDAVAVGEVEAVDDTACGFGIVLTVDDGVDGGAVAYEVASDYLYAVTGAEGDCAFGIQAGFSGEDAYGGL